MNCDPFDGWKRRRLRSAFLALIVSSGCRGPLAPFDSVLDRFSRSGSQEAAIPPELVAALKDDLGKNGWVRAAGDRLRDGERWRNAAADELNKLSPEQREALRRCLQADDPAVAANAAIILARSAGEAPLDDLAAAAGNAKLKLHQRLAAVESLGDIGVQEAGGKLRELLDRYGRFDGPDAKSYSAELHAELLHALSRQAHAADADRFVAALKSPAAEVRAAAISYWRQFRAVELSATIVELTSDDDPAVRAAALATLAARHDSRAREALAAATHDGDLTVRIAAAAGWAELGGAEAIGALERLLNGDNETLRQAAVAGFVRMKAQEQIFAAARDKSWRVRMEAAKGLADSLDQQAAEFAERLLDDPSPQVQAQTLAAISRWPRERRVPALLVALEESAYEVRQDAREQLVALWPDAAAYRTNDALQARQEQVAQLRQQWRMQTGTLVDGVVPAAVKAEGKLSAERLAALESLVLALADLPDEAPASAELGAAFRAYGKDLPASLAQLKDSRSIPMPPRLFSEILPAADPAFGTIAKYRAGDLTARREAMQQLHLRFMADPPSPLLASRLADLVPLDNDLVVWREALATVEHSGSSGAERLSVAALGHPHGEVRRRGCEHFAKHPSRAAASALLPALLDADPNVVRAAANALGRSGDSSSSDELAKLLASADRTLRVDVALSLCLLNDDRGRDALVRSSQDPDVNVRLQAVQAMSEAADPAFVPELIARLDDQGGVCAAAMNALARIAGADAGKLSVAGEPAASRAEEVRRWKQWADGRDAANVPLPPRG